MAVPRMARQVRSANQGGIAQPLQGRGGDRHARHDRTAEQHHQGGARQTGG